MRLSSQSTTLCWKALEQQGIIIFCVGLLLQCGLVLDSKKPPAADEPSASESWQARLLQPFHAVAAQLKEILSGGLLETTLLLQFIWFTNALAYYGLVLLTTSVSHHMTCVCILVTAYTT